MVPATKCAKKKAGVLRKSSHAIWSNKTITLDMILLIEIKSCTCMANKGKQCFPIFLLHCEIKIDVYKLKH